MQEKCLTPPNHVPSTWAGEASIKGRVNLEGKEATPTGSNRSLGGSQQNSCKAIRPDWGGTGRSPVGTWPPHLGAGSLPARPGPPWEAEDQPGTPTEASAVLPRCSWATVSNSPPIYVSPALLSALYPLCESLTSKTVLRKILWHFGGQFDNVLQNYKLIFSLT